MKQINILDIRHPSISDVIKRCLRLFGCALSISLLIWVIVNMPHYRQVPREDLPPIIFTNIIEKTVEVASLLGLSAMYSKLLTIVFWKHKRTFFRLFLQVVILSLINLLTALAYGAVFNRIHLGNASFFQCIFITDFFVVNVLSVTYFVSFLVGGDYREQITALETQLNNLAIQTNNHFLFNGFCTLSGLISKSPKDAQRFLDSLCQLYRYMVNNCNRGIVPLEDEIEFTNNYIILINYRFKGISISIDESLRKSNTYIVPISIQQLIENAVKHNGHPMDSPLYIKVYKQKDALIVENNINPLKDSPSPQSGTGLETLSRRIHIVSRKGIGIYNDGSVFRVIIPLIYEEDLMYEDMDY